LTREFESATNIEIVTPCDAYFPVRSTGGGVVMGLARGKLEKRNGIHDAVKDVCKKACALCNPVIAGIGVVDSMSELSISMPA
jgi:hypothetical protein